MMSSIRLDAYHHISEDLPRFDLGAFWARGRCISFPYAMIIPSTGWLSFFHENCEILGSILHLQTHPTPVYTIVGSWFSMTTIDHDRSDSSPLFTILQNGCFYIYPKSCGEGSTPIVCHFVPRVNEHPDVRTIKPTNLHLNCWVHIITSPMIL